VSTSARILSDGRWYDALSSAALYEAEYEQLIMRWAPDLFPDFIVVPFKVDVESEVGTHRPDLALIEVGYQGWWVVEVELSHHSLTGHVLPQVQGFLSGNYTAEHARYIAQQDARLKAEHVLEMIRGRSPNVYVIADQIKATWHQQLKPLGCHLGVVEVFRSEHNDHLLRVNGERPASSPPGIVPCRRDPVLPRTFIVDSPGQLTDLQILDLEIEYEGSMSAWRRVVQQDRVLLRPIKGDPLRGLTYVHLHVNASHLSFHRAQRNS
jgi:hypothetical protein